ncbi:MAG: glycoside hydrolase family 2 TIM barrel-domain containing protein [Clostridia bacterium]|nr:glycoside hydrolase family 2 TIM barrel-domain containing protein [Clostridia bacterium]
MRTILNINEGWTFEKPNAAPEQVNLPHTWNATDGQDGGNDYFRGECRYLRRLGELPKGELVYAEFEGANSSARVLLNGVALGEHHGGYSTWRVNLTPALGGENLLEVFVDNSPNDSVYPQMADFTFYGGLYRNVKLIGVSASHFDLDDAGGPGLYVTPKVKGRAAHIELKVGLKNAAEGQTIRYTVKDAEGNVAFEATVPASNTVIEFDLADAHLWQGRKDPYLYRADAELLFDGAVLDNVSVRFGCRAFEIDPARGFILNGEQYPLRGVSRHQDRWGVGNALLPQHHEEDIKLISELGATTIRLAHYQHAQYFYDLCDEYGMVVWAEIPYISKHLPNGRANTLSQMRELVTQNYNHPSIVVWGLSNEVTMSGKSDPDLIDNHRALNDLCHELDKTRLTTVAAVSMCDIHDEYLKIPDVISYNHYFGWYGGETSMNGPWFDNFRAELPDIPVGISEYGCEALNWHTSNPIQGDYTEEYQAYYHEELIKQIAERKYLWATHVWNMFDFGADARNEGGENGQNHKGLVTFDRSYKKDSFYAYKAWLSDEPFVHIAGKRYVDRVEDETRVTVYSNQNEVELFVNGVSVGKQTGAPFFYFKVPNVGESVLRAVTEKCSDESRIRKVAVFNEAYRLKEKGALLNWFDISAPEGYFSLNDKLGDIMKNPYGRELFSSLFKQFSANAGSMAAGMEINENMMRMMGGFTVLRLMNLMGTAGVKATKEQMLFLNEQLNKIPKK